MRPAIPLTVALALPILAGCGTFVDDMERDKQTKFEPSADRQSFVFRGHSSVALWESGPSSEIEPPLRRWLEGWLADNGMCPRGYTLTGQDRVQTYLSAYRVTYRGRCN